MNSKEQMVSLMGEFKFFPNVTANYLNFVESKLVVGGVDYLRGGQISELGEVSDILTKAMRSNKVIDLTSLVSELSDVLFYATPLGFLGSSWDDFLFLYNLLKKTPEEKFFGSSWVYTLGDLERFNMEKLNQRLKETGSHVK